MAVPLVAPVRVVASTKMSNRPVSVDGTVFLITLMAAVWRVSVKVQVVAPPEAMVTVACAPLVEPPGPVQTRLVRAKLGMASSVAVTTVPPVRVKLAGLPGAMVMLAGRPPVPVRVAGTWVAAVSPGSTLANVTVPVIRVLVSWQKTRFGGRVTGSDRVAAPVRVVVGTTTVVVFSIVHWRVVV